MQGDLDASLEYSQRAVAVMRQAAPEHPDVAVLENNLGISLFGLERFEDARTHFERSVEAARSALGPTHSMVGVALTGVGRAQVRLQRYPEAIESLEGALRLWGDAPVLPRHRFDARVSLAQALWEADRERGRARSLARLAIDEFAAVDDPDPERLAEARAWIDSRP